MPDALIPIVLAAFIYMAAGAELAQVLAEGRGRRRRDGRRDLDRPSGLLLGQPGQRRLAARPDPGPRLGPEPLAVALTPIVELGVAEAYELLTRHFGVTGLPPLEAIENEDWGRDSLLSPVPGLPRRGPGRGGADLGRGGARGPSSIGIPSRFPGQVLDPDVAELDPAVVALQPDQAFGALQAGVLGGELAGDACRGGRGRSWRR